MADARAAGGIHYSALHLGNYLGGLKKLAGSCSISMKAITSSPDFGTPLTTDYADTT